MDEGPENLLQYGKDYPVRIEGTVAVRADAHRCKGVGGRLAYLHFPSADVVTICGGESCMRIRVRDRSIHGELTLAQLHNFVEAMKKEGYFPYYSYEDTDFCSYVMSIWFSAYFTEDEKKEQQEIWREHGHDVIADVF